MYFVLTTRDEHQAFGWFGVVRAKSLSAAAQLTGVCNCYQQEPPGDADPGRKATFSDSEGRERYTLENVEPFFDQVEEPKSESSKYLLVCKVSEPPGHPCTAMIGLMTARDAEEAAQKLKRTVLWEFPTEQGSRLEFIARLALEGHESLDVHSAPEITSLV